MSYKFSFSEYSRSFSSPLKTSHGSWELREGIIIHLADDTGKEYNGEIAPIPWFGSESLSAALSFCQQLPSQITMEMIYAIPDELPACQFGFESALFDEKEAANLKFCGLLPTGKAALSVGEGLEKYDTWKWKIAVGEVEEELEILDLLIETLPKTAKLRLDANGGLSYDAASIWLERCEALLGKIEFIEQPLPVWEFEKTLGLSRCYCSAIALDESVASLRDLASCYEGGWRGIFVIKPGIIGSPSRLRRFLRENPLDVVFSSVFETSVGRKAALQLAGELSHPGYAVGFGVNHWFTTETFGGLRLPNSFQENV
ncbi:o-succinylbenzoate synthase [Calothrix sp. PCC 6303]|uniref:o-succinylbenzoate synthase n=1 Tax=Calothrix sp. PCC 6303 TaxID=1170562 RepID=UPI0002A008BF|nr:o-succinylbenzoate synthase [Calothrix sp. PCC 6303]AFZ03384.1 o-succinylbenzoic acid (OSB) synthetase [Calothrix sp. PCC 6303]